MFDDLEEKKRILTHNKVKLDEFITDPAGVFARAAAEPIIVVDDSGAELREYLIKALCLPSEQAEDKP